MATEVTEVRTGRVSLEVGGTTLSLETGHLARQADGAVVVRCGDSMVLVTATMSAAPREGIDFFPLTCDYEEKMFAAGKIPGGFFKREGRPGERATLTARLMDRPLRPLFPKGFRNDVQVVATVLSTDLEHTPDILAVVGAGAALAISRIPWAGPIAAVRIGLVDGQFVVNPPLRAIDERTTDLDLVVAGTAEAITMVEAGAREVPEARVLEALDRAHAEIRRIIEAINDLVRQAGRQKVTPAIAAPPEEITQAVRAAAAERLASALRSPDKHAREEAVAEVMADVQTVLAAQFPAEHKAIGEALDTLTKNEVRRMILDEGVRTDGRTPTQIRPLSAQVGLLPRAHGSGLFQRGQTQVLTAVTLGTGQDEQIIDDLSTRERKRYMHHYDFPPYSVGEARPMRSPGRREIGHGALAERSLEPVLPPEEEWPYTMRLVSTVLESNGSTSMASVCGSTLALMDAGVPIRKPVGGISMGLITGPEGDPGSAGRDGRRTAVLTDIQGIEDAMGDMDFKVAGTRDGITGLQLDIKIKGLSREIFERAFAQARDARMAILDVIERTIPRPRPEMSPYAPRITTIMINPERIREVIGPGGKVINKITAETGVKIDIEQDGRVLIASADGEAAARAQRMIEDIVREAKPGETYRGRVTRLMNFGAFVEIFPGKEGLVHISELSHDRVARVEDAVKVGDEVEVKVKEIDNLGRINLSRRALLPRPEGLPAEPEGEGTHSERSGSDRPGSGRSGYDRGGRDRDRGSAGRDGRRGGGGRRHDGPRHDRKSPPGDGGPGAP
ncbi:MAG TPA: polyribonucleotide nucleotidyltransferase [bacterium]|nr:polyribonucleotide nucleotidyltransferase [bacterium]